MGGVPSSKNTTLLSLELIGLVKVEIRFFNLLRDQNIKESSDFGGGVFSS